MLNGELVQPLVHCFAYDDVIPIETADNVVADHQVVIYAKPLANVQLAGYLADQFIRVNAELAAVHDSSVVDVDEVCHVLNVCL
jgi:hypothetical protein